MWERLVYSKLCIVCIARWRETHFCCDLHPLFHNAHVWLDKENGRLDHSVRLVFLDLEIHVFSLARVYLYVDDILSLEPLLQHVLRVRETLEE